MDYSLPGSSAHGISQASILEWVAISSSRSIADPGIEPESPALAGGFFTAEPAGKPKSNYTPSKNKQTNKKTNPKERKFILKNPCFFLVELQGLWSALTFPDFLWLLTWSASKSSFSGFYDTRGSWFSSRTAHLWFVHWLFLPPSPTMAISPQLSPHLPFSPLLIAALDFACLALKC